MEKGYICWCQQSFRSSIDFTLHEKSHLEENKLYCSKNVDMDTKYTLLNRIQDSNGIMNSWADNSVEFKSIHSRYDYICEEDPLACTSKIEPVDLSGESEGEPENREETTHKQPQFVCNVCNCRFWKKKYYVRHSLKHRKMLNKKDHRDVVTTNIIRKTSNSKRKCISGERSKKMSVCLSTSKTQRSSPYPRRVTDNLFPLTYDTGGGFQCSFCPYNSIRKKDTIVHEKRVHSGDTPYICDICPCSMNSSRAFRYHVAHFHPEFINNGVLKEHAAFHEPSTAIESADLSKSEKSNVTNNRKRSTQDNNLSCCRFSPFKCKDNHTEGKNSPKSKPKPVVIVAPKRNPAKKEVVAKKPKVVIVYADELTCSYCPLSLTSKQNKRRHEWIHTGVMPYSCVHCGASFRKITTYKNHQHGCRGITPSKPRKSDSFSCHYCDATYKTEIMLTRHENKAHRTVSVIRNPPKKSVSFPCDICDASFQVQSMVDAHKRRAHKKKPQVERKKNVTTDTKVPHFVNCMEVTDGMLKKEFEFPQAIQKLYNNFDDSSYEEMKNISITDNAQEFNNFYERPDEVEDFPMAYSHEQSEPVQDFPFTDDIPDANSIHKQSELIPEFPMTDNVLVLNDSNQIPTQIQECPMTEIVPELNGMEENFTIKQELVESPEHYSVHDKQLWSEFIVIDDDD